jgi:aconitate hydratase
LDGNPATSVFLASPETVIVKAFSGKLDFDPSVDAIGDFMFQPPSTTSLPENGYLETDYVYAAPPSERASVQVNISPDSERIQKLAPFAAWDGKDYLNLPILIKTKGKCTTDHITCAGPWMRYRGHLENISNNTLIGAVNAENEKVNSVRNVFTGEYSGVPDTAKDYKKRNQRWVVIADSNYGEGSSREHAALQPRFLNGVAVIARSFARIHESNLKKQGMLPLTFANSSDYDRISSEDRVSIIGLTDIQPGQPLTIVVEGKDGKWEAELNQTFNAEQLSYFRAGSALNLMALNAKANAKASL